MSLHRVGGHDLILLGRGYLALCDAMDIEVSDRIPGTMWSYMTHVRVAGGSQATQMFLPESKEWWDKPAVTFPPCRAAVSSCGWFLTHEESVRKTFPLLLGWTRVIATPGDVVSIRYRDALESLANDLL